MSQSAPDSGISRPLASYPAPGPTLPRRLACAKVASKQSSTGQADPRGMKLHRTALSPGGRSDNSPGQVRRGGRSPGSEFDERLSPVGTVRNSWASAPEVFREGCGPQPVQPFAHPIKKSASAAKPRSMSGSARPAYPAATSGLPMIQAHPQWSKTEFCPASRECNRNPACTTPSF
jgi:hypothetical protein